MGVRKSVASLTADERARFVAAVLELKRIGTYDRYVAVHTKAMMQMRPDPAHGGPGFFPWHREYLRRFELDLQSVDPSVSIPYWDWTRQRALDGPPWTEDFMGGDGVGPDNRVATGPFAHPAHGSGEVGNWSITVMEDMGGMPMTHFLTRTLGRPASLPTAREVSAILKVVPFDAEPWNFNTRKGFRSRLEMNPHNGVHIWVGGNMTMASSPNDPVFWLHHCQVDRLWARWQRLHSNTPYLPRTGGPKGHNLRDPMWPWRKETTPPTPASVLKWSKLGYSYDDETGW